MSRRLATAAVLAFAALVAACGGDDDHATAPLFTRPWSGEERYTYNLVQRGGDVYGTCVLETKPNAEPGKVQLNRLCADEPFRDDGTVTADAETLRPEYSLRTVVDDEGKRRTHESQYDAEAVHMTTTASDSVHEADRGLPEPDEKSPDPAWYDDESLLWLVRGVPLQSGYSGAYWDVAAAIGRLIAVDIEVTGRERVSVPAGEFNTWKVEVKTSSITQAFWVEAEAPHRIIRARVERLTYELTGAQ